MPGEVLYRRWRPRRFQDVAGQETVITTLRHAVAQSRVAHAYLFCGPRGTGKTSTARILAKAVNCLTPHNGEPDGSCARCTAIDEGRALDLIEIDAASNRGVDDARSLRERVFGSGPAEARFKVYIIDEAHMLTTDASNTLLKTLEEPAPWAIFILCTTEAQKLLATIISRCQRFDFRRITAGDTVLRLEAICRGEGYQTEPEALLSIARASGGSLRDACNLLEQLASASGGTVTRAAADEMLGLRGGEHALPLVKHVLTRDVAAALALLNTDSESGVDLRVLHREVMASLRGVLLLRSGAGEALEMSRESIDELRAIAPQTTTEQVLKAIRAFARANLKAAEAIPTLPLELAVVEACTAPEPAAAPDMARPAPSRPPVSAAPARTTGAGSAAPARPSNIRPGPGEPAPVRTYLPPRASASGSPPRAEAPSALPRSVPSPQPTLAPRAAPPSPQWEAVKRSLRQTRGKNFNIGSLLLDCTEQRTEGNTLVLVFRSPSNMERLQKEMEQPDIGAAVQKAVRDAFPGDYQLKMVANGNRGAQGKPSGYLVRTALGMGSRIIGEAKEDPL